MEIDIYDFDKTVIPFDSSSKFIIFCFVHYPWTLITLPVILICAVPAVLGIISYTSFKKVCFMFVPMIPLEKAVSRFWDKYEPSVYPWFKEGKKRYSVVISASPDFLLNDIADRLGFDKLICSRHNKKTGALTGKNCRGEEKVRRFYEEYDKGKIKVCDVYSDSIKNDRPIFSLAQGRCFNVKGGVPVEFDYTEIYGYKE